MTTPASAVTLVESIATKLIALATKDLVPLAENSLPLPLKEILVAVMAMPWVQDEIAHLEAAGVAEIGALVGGLVVKLKAAVDAEARKHPALAPLWAKVEGSPVAGVVLSFAADEVKAFLAAKQGGYWAKVRGFLVELGVLQAA